MQIFLMEIRKNSKYSWSCCHFLSPLWPAMTL